MAFFGENIKKLGFGLMRLPKNGEEIDIEQTKEMVDRFLEAGFTYFDTAYVYNGSEEATRKALVERHPRESYQLATKNAAWVRCETREDAIKQFETSLERTGAGYFDFYLLHNLGQNRSKVFEDFDMWNFVLQKKAEGLIKHIGFSFHSTPEDLEEILKAHPEAEFVQLQINYLDWEDAAIQSRGCYEVARKYGKPVVIMEPVKGGLLANPPENVAKILKNADEKASYASWALRFAAGLEGVITVLSGMSNLEQMEDNIANMEKFTGLSKEEEAVLTRAREALKELPLIPCTRCNYCTKVCPMDIAIPGSFSVLNYHTLFHKEEEARERLVRQTQEHKHPRECVGCGACEEACPQHISIRDELKRAVEALA